MTEQTKPIYELEFAAVFLGNGSLQLVPVSELEDPSDALEAVKDNLFAEVVIPHHTDSAIYGYVFHVFNKANHEPAIVETILIQAKIGKIHKDYHHLAQPMEVLPYA